jgi:hypothetical protein
LSREPGVVGHLCEQLLCLLDERLGGARLFGLDTSCDLVRSVVPVDEFVDVLSESQAEFEESADPHHVSSLPTTLVVKSGRAAEHWVERADSPPGPITLAWASVPE